MKYLKARLVKSLSNFFEDDFRRIEHALSVLHETERISEKISNVDYEVLISAALLHDTGIKQSEKELGYNNGKTQEMYGPPIAEKLLENIGLDQPKIKKICEIISNHHSPSKYPYVELDILKEADKIVNKREASKKL